MAKPLRIQWNARSLALQVLLQVRARDLFAQNLLEDAWKEIPMEPLERRLCTQLAFGVLRRRSALDALLRLAVTRPQHRVEPWLWETLRLGVYQLAYLTHVPGYAAINETVELAANYGQARGKGFLNGVLRAVLGMLTDEMSDEPAANALPVGERRYRRLTKPAFPDPTDDPDGYLAQAFSLPPWLAPRWRTRFGWQECLRLGFWFAGPVPLALRINPLRTDRAELLQRFLDKGVDAEAGDHPQAIRILDSSPIRELPGYAQGHFVVQDEWGMHVGSALAPKPGSRVLDLCAGPGGKTTHLAEMMENRGQLIACDISADRLEPLVQTSQRLGQWLTSPMQIDPEGDPPAGPFDAILVDVPCSQSGLLGRHPEVRWRLKLPEVQRLVPLQTKLLLQACERLAPGGAAVYATCSLEPEENQHVVEAVRQAFPQLRLDGEEERLPGRPGDGGYWARLRRVVE